MIELYEQKLMDTILPQLERGRPGWDLPHTKAVVYYTKKLLDYHPKLKKHILITAAYAHDWGYADLFDKKDINLEEVRAMKEKHMQIGAQKIAVLLKEQEFTDFSKKDKQRIVHLVSIHDKLDSLEAEDELVLMEADTLGALDTDFITPTYDKDSNAKMMQNMRTGRIPKFITPDAKLIAEEVFTKRENYYA